MSRYTSEYSRDSKFAYEMDCCLIRNDIWLIQVLSDSIEICKFNTDTCVWKRVKSKNAHLAFPSHAESSCEDFTISTTNGKIYLFKAFPGASRLSEFDPMTLEWRELMYINRVPINSQIAILDDQIKKYFLGELMTQEHQVHMVEIDGIMYLVGIDDFGTRNVYQYNIQTKKIRMITNDYAQYQYLENIFEPGYNIETLRVFVWAETNTIYQATVNWKDDLILDQFDLQTKEWTTILNIPLNCSYDDVQRVFKVDNKLYIVVSELNTQTIKVLDLAHTLETIFQLVDMAYTKTRNVLPYGLRETFDNMIVRKVRENDHHNKKENMTRIAK